MEQLSVPNTIDSLKTIADFVIAVAAAADLDRKTAYKLRLAVDEIATNIILYGYQPTGCSGGLNLQADIDEKTLTILIEDTAIHYDPTLEMTPDDLDKPLEKRKFGHLGVYIAIHSVDKFIYERVDNRNRNIFIVNRKLG